MSYVIVYSQNPRMSAPLDRPQPRYQQVARRLRDAIRSGEYPPGSALPSQPELAAQYELNQTTINRAIAVLRSEGLVRVERGKGAFVLNLPKTRRVRTPTPANPNSFASEIERTGLKPTTKLVKTAEEVPPEHVGHQLGLEDGERALVRSRQMFASDEPVQLATSYMPVALALPDVIHPDTNPSGVYERLKVHGYIATFFTEEVEVRSGLPHETQFLGLEDGQPVLEVTRIVRSQDHEPMDVAVNILPSLQWKLVYHWENAE